jgi:hypothetical protein
MKVLKKRPITKQNPNKRKAKKSKPIFFSLFIIVVLLLVDVGAIIIIIFLLCSKKWLLSYVPFCHENLESRFTINPLNGIVIGLSTRPLYIKMELEPFFLVS